jgi:hypothetical protein
VAAGGRGGNAGWWLSDSLGLLTVTGAEADRVADAIGDLPIAVEQAGSLIADIGMAVDSADRTSRPEQRSAPTDAARESNRPPEGQAGRQCMADQRQEAEQPDEDQV